MGKIKVGDVFSTKKGDEAVVLEYNGCKDVIVKFTDVRGYVVSVVANNLRSGAFRNPGRPSVYGVGYYGIGDHVSKIDGKHTRAYRRWNDMLKRGYCPKEKARYPTYADCSVDKEWHNFQVFADWFYDQPNSTREDFALDKDLMVWGNKTYSKDFCSFVPEQINTLLNDHGSARGDFPQGITKLDDGYVARLSVHNERIYLGYYNTADDAYQVYREAKSAHVRKLADRYKDDLHPTVYKNLMTWELE
jgi:hypothetical protein